MLLRHGARRAPTLVPEVRTCLVLRHAVALPRWSWRGDDALRPLSRRGDRQAVALARNLSVESIRRVLASPARRCVATVAAIAEDAGLLVEIAPFLAEGSDGLVALKRLVAACEAMGPGVLVACTHGDVLGGVVVELVESGGIVSPPRAIQKGGAIRLSVVSGTIAAVSIVPAPA